MYLLYYYCVTGISVEIIIMFRVCKQKRNCRQIAYTCRGWYVLRDVALTVDCLPSHSFYNSVTKILVAVRLGFRFAPVWCSLHCVRWTSASVVCDCEPHRSAVAEHNTDCHDRVLQNTRFLAKESRSRERFKRKAIEVHLDPNKVNREDGFSVSKWGNPPIYWRK